MLKLLLGLSGEVAGRLRQRGLAARTIGIKVRFADFSHRHPGADAEGWTDQSAAVYGTAVALYRSLGLDRPRIRLLGVKAEGFRAATEVAEQLTLDVGPAGADAGRGLSAEPAVASAVDRVVDAARERFGPGSVGYAALLSNSTRARNS